MLLEYHWIGDEDERWTRSRAGLRRDLEYLHRNGYYLVGIDALYENRLAVPAGKSPVVLTFDDSNRSQFQMLVGPDGKLTVDPMSGLGVLEGFLREHPDFGRAAVFCVLPKADPPNDLFGQEELRGQKLRYLVEQGYELCNHTWWHQNLRDADDAEVVRQIALAARDVAELVPGYRMTVFNPPMGIYARDRALMLHGKHDGHAYKHRVVLEVAGGPFTAPNHRKTDFLHVPRIQAIPSELDRWFGHFERNPDDRYVSDGDPNRLVFPADRLDDFVPPGGAMELPAPAPGFVAVRLR